MIKVIMKNIILLYNTYQITLNIANLNIKNVYEINMHNLINFKNILSKN